MSRNSPDTVNGGPGRTVVNAMPALTPALGQACIEFLLERKGLNGNDRMCQSRALEEFDLQIHDLHGLSYITQDNPHGRFFAPMRLYLNWDLAGRAIDIHGAVGEDVELRSQRAEQAARRKATAHRIRAEQARRAAAFTPTDAVGRLCQAVGVHPDATLTKTRTMEVFRLNSRQLGIMNVPFERATNPVHARFARMQLYRAADVARACIRHGIGVSLPARNEAVTARRELEQRRMWASVLAAAMGMDRE